MIYIGIPAHEERDTVGPLLWRIRELLIGSGREFHVLAVDDGSSDGTAARLEAYGEVLPLTLLRHETRRGYAASLERLVREVVERSDYPRRDALVTLQADFTDAPEVLPEMVRRFSGGADLVGAAPAAEDPAPPRAKRAVRWGARFLARTVAAAPEEAGDPFASLRLYRLFTLARALDDLADGQERLLAHRGWAANAELLFRAWPHVRRAECVEVPRGPARRYRPSRFRPWREMVGLRRASRDAGLRRLARSAGEAG